MVLSALPAQAPLVPPETNPVAAFAAGSRVLVYGCGKAGRLARTILEVTCGLHVAGFVDSNRDGMLDGLPITNAQTLVSDGAETPVLIFSAAAAEIKAHLAALGAGFPVLDATGWLYDLAGHLLGVNRDALQLEYDYALESCFGGEAGCHDGLLSLIAAHDPAYRALLGDLLPFAADLAGVEWVPQWLPALDAISLYGLIRHTKPRRYWEVGSGTSTRFARRAIGDGGLTTELLSIDPAPRAEIDALCDRVLRQPLESLDPSLFDTLEAGDILFIDGSHRCLQGSDATYLFTQALPRLASGVLVGIHDIFLPWDYPAGWQRRGYSEQYPLASLMLLAPGRVTPVLPVHYVSHSGRFDAAVDDLYRAAAAPENGRGGGTFWFHLTPMGHA
jgi:hypothetical protein